MKAGRTVTAYRPRRHQGYYKSYSYSYPSIRSRERIRLPHINTKVERLIRGQDQVGLGCLIETSYHYMELVILRDWAKLNQFRSWSDKLNVKKVCLKEANLKLANSSRVKN